MVLEIGLFLWLKYEVYEEEKREVRESVKRTCIFFNFVYTTQHTDMLIKINLKEKTNIIPLRMNLIIILQMTCWIKMIKKH